MAVRVKRKHRNGGRPFAVKARKVARLKAQGLSYSEIAERLGISRATAFRAMVRHREPVYRP